MRPLSFLVAGVVLTGGSTILLQAAPVKTMATSKARPPIDIVFAIDCSGSMGGVIETAKQKIWDIVNQAAQAKPTPQLRIGLLAYGNGSRT
ncbi:VWA domain-containing protein, partial [bacterium]